MSEIFPSNYVLIAALSAFVIGVIICYRDRKTFKSFLAVIGTGTGIILAAAVLVEMNKIDSNRKKEQVEKYGEYSEMVLDKTLEFFADNPDMIYYYNDLIGKKRIDANTQRNYTKEHIISMLIFSRMAKFAIFVQYSPNDEAKDKIKAWLGRIFDTFISSPTLRQYWIKEYKPKFSGPASKEYMEKHYGL